MSKKLLAALGTAVLLAGCTLPGMPADDAEPTLEDVMMEGTVMEEAAETPAMEAVKTPAMEEATEAPAMEEGAAMEEAAETPAMEATEAAAQ